MIYTKLPLKCRFIPIDVDDEVFQTVFMFHFTQFLEYSAQIFMEIVDEADENGIDEGGVLFFADWAKHTYKNKEAIKEDMDEFKYKCFCNKDKKYIIDNVKANQIGFDFGNMTYNNVYEGAVLYKAILPKI